MSPGLGCVGGLVGAAAGTLTVPFALSVPAEGRLPAPTAWRRANARHQTVVTVIAVVLSATVSAILGLVLGRSILLPAYWICALLGVVLGIVDVRVRRLPYLLAALMVASCLLAFLVQTILVGDPRRLIFAFAAGSLAFVAFLALALALPGQLGLGDVVLVGWIGLSLGWFGWRPVVIGLLFGLIVQAVVGVVFRVASGRDGALPMGPALLLGWLVGVVVGAW